MSLKYESMSLKYESSSESIIGGVSPQPKTPADELISFGPIAYQRALWERLVQPLKTIVGLNQHQKGFGYRYLWVPLSSDVGTCKTVNASDLVLQVIVLDTFQGVASSLRSGLTS